MIARPRLHAAMGLACAALVACGDGEIRLTSGASLTDATTVDEGAPEQEDGGPGSTPNDSGDESAQSDTATTGVAHGCSQDSDCKLSTLHCNVSSGVCVPCVRDDQCTTPGFPRCDLAQHRCVACGVSADCGDGGVCDPATLQCVVACRDGGGCPLDDRGCDSHGYCTSCNGDASACPGMVCDDDNGTCGECSRDSQCPSARPHCDRTRDRCVECLTSSDCPAAKPICDPSTWTCVP